MPEEDNNVHGICTPYKYMHKSSIQGDSIGITMPGTKNDLTFYVCSGLDQKYLQVSCCGGHRDHGTGIVTFT